MKKFNDLQIKILDILSDGYCHNDEDLIKATGLCSASVWQKINQLIAIGVPVKILPTKKYQLKSPLSLLKESDIRQNLINIQSDIHIFATLESTNRYLKDLPASGNIEICCAEQQTKGRGRFNREWYSPFGENIYCSSRWKFSCNLEKLSGLSLIVSLAVKSTIQQYYQVNDIKVKWPNDLIWQDKKLCGSLIEMQTSDHEIIEIIIGIGLNVNSITKDHSLPDKPWCSLREITGNVIDRNKLIAKLICTLARYLKNFMANGMKNFYKEWAEADYLENKEITVTHMKNEITGKAQGINESGQLKLMDKEGIIHFLSSGDTSLNRKN